MLLEFRNHISTNFPFLIGKKILVACSGGLDSVVLTKLCDLIELDFSIAHCNFNLRGIESNDDEKFVKQLAEEVNAAFFVNRFDTKIFAEVHHVSIQMAARTLRYEWFLELATELGCDYVLTAHHADDNIETFLINLSRGTGIDGLVGIPEVNSIYIRPLLPFSRQNILDFATKYLLKWREDSSNSSIKYLRNKLRHDVVPQLKSVNPQFLQNFGNTLKYLKQANDFIKSQVNELSIGLLEQTESGCIKIPIYRIEEFDNPKVYVYFLLNQYGFTAWDDIVKILKAQSGKQIFSKTHRLVKDRDYLLITPISEEHIHRSYIIPNDENMIMIPIGTMKFKKAEKIEDKGLKTIFIDKKLLKYPLIVRKWKEGDYFYPLGMKGKKKLSKYFKDEKLSLVAKERVWLLCSDKEIVWVINYRVDNRYKITDQTKEILKISIT